MVELAYSLHLGSDKNRKNISRQNGKNNLSKSTSLPNNAIQNVRQLSKVDKHNYRKYDGLILLASYVTNDLTHTDLDVISIYGTEDKVLNMDKYNKYKVNLPDGYQEMIIDGGNHAYYGVYGEQKGDGQAKISNEQQIKQTVDILRILLVDNKRDYKM